MQIYSGCCEEDITLIRLAVDRISLVLSPIERTILDDLCFAEGRPSDLAERLFLKCHRQLSNEEMFRLLRALHRKIGAFFMGSGGAELEVRLRLAGAIKPESTFRLEPYKLLVLAGRSSDEKKQILRVLSKVELTDGERMILEELNAMPLGPADSTNGAMSAVGRIWKRLEDQGSTRNDSGFVRTAISKIRAKLDSFSKSPAGLLEDVRVQILHNTRRDERFHFKVEWNHLRPGASAFWASHLRTGSPLKIVIGQPIFFGSTSGLLVRDYLSDAQQSPPWVQNLFGILSKTNQPDDALGTIPRIAPFAATQDFRGALALLRYFDGWRSKGHPAPEFFGARESEAKDSRFTNAVFLGSPFENPFIWDLDCNWYDSRMEEAEKAAGDSHVPPMKEYWDTEQHRKQLPGSTAERRKAGFYGSLILDKLTASEGDVVVIVSRLSNSERTITSVESLDPMAVRVICDVLADEREMAQVVSAFGIDVPWKGFPDNFEMSFLIRLPKTTEEFAVQVRAECWGSRVLHLAKDLGPSIVGEDGNPIKR